MFTPKFTITPKITKDLEVIGTIFGYLQALNLPEGYKKELVSRVTAETVHASTAIEGNTLTERQVTDVLSGKKITALERDIREVQNYNKALLFTENGTQRRGFEVSEEFLKQIHTLVVKDIRDDIAGIYRTIQVHVGDYLPPQPYLITSLIKELVNWLKTPQPQDLSPILYAGIAHYQFVAIHPFEDGNGRTSRLLTTLMLLQNSYNITKLFALESHYNRDRKSYYEALASADRYRIDGQPDLTRWLEYFVNGILIEAERAKSRIEELLQKSRVYREKIWLNLNQQKILKLTLEKGTAKAADYLKVTALSRKGCYKTSMKLVNLGLLKRNGENKGTYYSITQKGLEYVK